MCCRCTCCHKGYKDARKRKRRESFAHRRAAQAHEILTEDQKRMKLVGIYAQVVMMASIYRLSMVVDMHPVHVYTGILSCVWHVRRWS